MATCCQNTSLLDSLADQTREEMMTRFFLAFAIAVALVVSLPAIGKADKILLKTISSGTYGPADVPMSIGGSCANSGCVGPLTGLTCAGDTPFANVEAISPVQQTFYFIDQVCEDRPSSSLPACAGPFRFERAGQRLRW